VEREKRALEMALYVRRRNANQAEIDHIKDERRKHFADKEALNAEFETKRLESSGHLEQIGFLRAKISSMESKLVNLQKLKGEVERGLEDKLLESKDKSSLFDYFNV
jgi:chromosome segregation ATPase